MAAFHCENSEKEKINSVCMTVIDYYTGFHWLKKSTRYSANANSWQLKKNVTALLIYWIKWKGDQIQIKSKAVGLYLLFIFIDSSHYLKKDTNKTIIILSLYSRNLNLILPQYGSHSWSMSVLIKHITHCTLSIWNHTNIIR